MKVDGAVVVVTGAASGIGFALAQALTERDCRVVLADLDGDAVEAAAQELGGAATAVACDVRDRAAVEALADVAQARHGDIDLVFNNAGVMPPGGPAIDAEPQDLEWVLAVNVVGTWNGCSVFGKRLAARSRAGWIVNTASEHSLGVQHTGQAFYTASKHAVLGLSDVLRAELPEHVGISVLCPGLVQSRLWDASRHRARALDADARALLPISHAVMDRGMPAREVADKAIAGVERGDFSLSPTPRRTQPRNDAAARSAQPSTPRRPTTRAGSITTSPTSSAACWPTGRLRRDAAGCRAGTQPRQVPPPLICPERTTPGHHKEVEEQHMANDQRVLVTGGSGFIAGHCIGQALNQGYRVRTTVRDLARERDVRAQLARLVNGDDRLEVVAADLTADKGWPEAAAECAYVLHVASPFPVSSPKDDAELVRPARDGALRVLAAAQSAGARRVVMTSSTAAVAYGRGSSDTALTEADWSDESNRSDTSSYERSKTIAERAAWDWVAREGGTLELATICPGAVLGPVLGPDRSASIDIVARLLDGSLPGIARFGWPLVDVRDVADLHLRAMTAAGAAGQRYIAAGPFTWMSDIADVLREHAPALAARVPRRRLPDAAVRLAGLFDPALRGRLYELGKHRPVSAEKARRELHWTPRTKEEAIIATAESLAPAELGQAS